MRVEKLSENVISVTAPELERAEPIFITDSGRTFRYWRGGYNGGPTTYIGRRPTDLHDEDMRVINEDCDQKEGSRNRLVKKDIAGALSRHFNGKAVHMYEMGCGKRPLLAKLSEDMDVSYHGIECDPECIEELQSLGITATDWSAAMDRKPPKDRPSVAVAIYAMHFMVEGQFAKNIAQLTSDDEGFFVGNFYIDPLEAESGEERERLKNILNRHNLHFAVMKYPKQTGNEYWVIGKNENTVEGFAKDMQDSVRKRRKGKELIRTDKKSPAFVTSL